MILLCTICVGPAIFKQTIKGYDMHASDKRHQTRYFGHARAIVAALLADPALDIVQAFETVRTERRASATELMDAFWVLDNQPGRFAGHWHGRLRQCRNHPIDGPRLFALWTD